MTFDIEDWSCIVERSMHELIVDRHKRDNEFYGNYHGGNYLYVYRTGVNYADGRGEGR